jgi:aspartyl-tRNA(Asn)/glutamyl-tRNA(Gln) amidotransferase subunit B
MILADSQKAAWKAELPELPVEKRHRYQTELGLSAYDTRVLTDDRSVAEYLEATIAAGADIKQAANWVMGDITAYLKTQKVGIGEIALTPTVLAELIGLIDKGTILPELFENGGSVQKLVESKGLISISDPAELAKIVDTILAANPKELEQYKAGKTKLLGFFVGQMMKETGGRAEPKLANQILNQKLNA